MPRENSAKIKRCMAYVVRKHQINKELESLSLHLYIGRLRERESEAQIYRRGKPEGEGADLLTRVALPPHFEACVVLWNLVQSFLVFLSNGFRGSGRPPSVLPRV